MSEARASTAIVPNETGASRGTSGNSTENKYMKYLSADETYSKEINEIREAISTLDSVQEQAIMKCRYLNFEKIEEIEKNENYSKRQVTRILRNATIKIKVVP